MTEARRLTALQDTTYLGSHPRMDGEIDGIEIIFTSEGIALRRRRDVMPLIPWSEISELEALDHETVEREISLGSILLFGAFAWFVQTKTVNSYLSFKDSDGRWVFAVPDLKRFELAKGLESLQAYLPQLPKVANGAASIEDRLAQLADLHARGLITDEVHAERQREIVAEL